MIGPPTAAGATPYVLAPLRFRFRALAALAGHAPLGGTRESVIATLLVARLARDCTAADALPAALRLERAGAARSWLASVTLPPPTRVALMSAIDASTGDAHGAAVALRRLTEVVGSILTSAARLELDRLARELAQ